MSYFFSAAIMKEDDWYVARAIELGVASQGKTVDEAKKNLTEAVELYLEELTPEERPKSQKPVLATLKAELHR